MRIQQLNVLGVILYALLKQQKIKPSAGKPASDREQFPAAMGRRRSLT
jgi:hypothetical protein